MTPHQDVGVRAFADADRLDAWPAAHPAPHPGLWVKVAKKGAGLRSVTARDVNDVALCHGWTTGNRRRLGESYFLQRITPRRPGSDWSMVNVRGVGELGAAGRMRPGGLAEVAAAGRTGAGRTGAGRPRTSPSATPRFRRISPVPCGGTGAPGRPSSDWAGRTGTSSCWAC